MATGLCWPVLASAAAFYNSSLQYGQCPRSVGTFSALHSFLGHPSILPSIYLSIFLSTFPASDAAICLSVLEDWKIHFLCQAFVWVPNEREGVRHQQDAQSMLNDHCSDDATALPLSPFPFLSFSLSFSLSLCVPLFHFPSPTPPLPSLHLA